MVTDEQHYLAVLEFKNQVEKVLGYRIDGEGPLMDIVMECYDDGASVEETAREVSGWA